MDRLLVANWKMKLSRQEGITLAKNISDFFKDSNIKKSLSISIAPSMPILSEISNIILKSDINLAAQDCSAKDNGAYTGEVSAKILKECGCKYVILGHSERRQEQKETSELILKKTALAYKYGIIPIICIGENIYKKNQEDRIQELNRQLTPLLSLREYSNKELIVAYEPVWAIGSGIIPTTQQILEVAQHIQNIMKSASFTTNKNLKILYGGSVTSDNCQEILKISGIGGLLIGGASLIYDRFIRILKAAFEIENASN